MYVSLTVYISFYECKLVFVFCSVLWRLDLGRIYSYIAQKLKFDWSTQITWKRQAVIGSKSFFEIGVLNIFAKPIGKHLSRSLFNQSAATCSFKVRLRHRYFLVNFIKLKNIMFTRS